MQGRLKLSLETLSGRPARTLPFFRTQVVMMHSVGCLALGATSIPEELLSTSSLVCPSSSRVLNLLYKVLNL